MRTFSNVKGLPVFETETGDEIGKVIDLCFCQDGHIKGVYIDTKGLFKRNKYTPLSEISSIGQDGLMVKNRDCLHPISEYKRDVSFILDKEEGFIGKTLMTEEGEKLGLVEDVYFLEEMGTIIGCEVTDGFFADMAEGRKVIKVDEPLTIGEKVIVAKQSVKGEKQREVPKLQKQEFR